MENNNSLTLHNLIGTVLDYDIETRSVYVYVGKIMPMLYSKELKEYIGETQSSKLIIKNKITIDKTIKHSNVLIAKPYDYDEKLPAIGSKVSISFFEDNINRIYWSKIKITDDMYAPIEEELYDNICTLNIGDKTEKLQSNDVIDIVLPDAFIANISIDPLNNKHKTITISDNIGLNIKSLKENIIDLQQNMSASLEIYRDTLYDILTINIKSINSTLIDQLNADISYDSKTYNMNNIIVDTINSYNTNLNNLILNSENFKTLYDIKKNTKNTNSVLLNINNMLSDLYNCYTDSRLNAYHNYVVRYIRPLLENNLQSDDIAILNNVGTRIEFLLRTTRTLNLIGNIYNTDTGLYTKTITISCDLFSNKPQDINTKYVAEYNDENVDDSILYTASRFKRWDSVDKQYSNLEYIDNDYDLYPVFDLCQLTILDSTTCKFILQSDNNELSITSIVSDNDNITINTDFTISSSALAELTEGVKFTITLNDNSIFIMDISTN